MPDDQDNHLISPPPRDSLMLRRRAALQSDSEARIKSKMTRDLALYDEIPRGFAKHYFRGKVSFDELKPLEKKEFKKLCLRRFIRNCIFLVAPFGLGTLTLILLAASRGLGAMFFVGLIGSLMSILGIMLTYAVHSCALENFDLSDQANFVRIHLFLKRHNLLEK